MTQPKLHGFSRSGAAYRVRIVLNLKGIPFTEVSHNLRKGEQLAPSYLFLNPQGLVPTIEINDAVLTQSLAICEYLDDIGTVPRLLPIDALRKAEIRAAAQVIVCDTHPVQNLKVLNRLRGLGLAEEQVTGWARHAIEEGLDAFERLVQDEDGPYSFGSQVTLADVCMVPQMVNARRFGVTLRWPRLLAIEQACLAMEEFRRAAPENQPDA